MNMDLSVKNTDTQQPSHITLRGDKIHPHAELNPAGMISFKGNFISSDSSAYCEPITDWLELYVSNPSPYTLVRLEFQLFSPDSVKIFLHAISPLKSLMQKDHDVEIFWFIEKGDSDMAEIAELYADFLKIPVKAIEIT
jgi:hypothetical protein